MQSASDPAPRGVIIARAEAFDADGVRLDVSLAPALAVGPSTDGTTLRALSSAEIDQSVAEVSAQDKAFGEPGMLLAAVDGGQGLTPEAVAVADEDDPGAAEGVEVTP